jgi:hypothetical protein
MIRYSAGVLALGFALAGCAQVLPAESSADLTKTISGQVLTLTVSTEPQPYRELVANLTKQANAKANQGGLAPAITAAFAACGEVRELPHTQICVFSHKRFMNLALNRASQWVEAGELMDHERHALSRQNSQVEGHDLTADSIREFRKVYDQRRASMKIPVGNFGPEVQQIVALERELQDSFIAPTLAKQSDMVLLAVAMDTDLDATLDHEILHAQYFQTPAMRSAVDSYFSNAVSKVDAESITSKLAGSGAYKVTPSQGDSVSVLAKKRSLLVNEFQAYMLMRGANGSFLSRWVPAYQAGLTAALKAKGVTPFGASATAPQVPPPVPGPTTPPGGGGGQPGAAVKGLVCTDGATRIVAAGFRGAAAPYDVSFSMASSGGTPTLQVGHVTSTSPGSYDIRFDNSAAWLSLWNYDGKTAASRYWFAPGLKMGEFSCVQQ